jgi:hypothetical protein
MIDSVRIYRDIFNLSMTHGWSGDGGTELRSLFQSRKRCVIDFGSPPLGHRRGRHLTSVMSAGLVSTNLFELLQA